MYFLFGHTTLTVQDDIKTGIEDNKTVNASRQFIYIGNNINVNR